MSERTTGATRGTTVRRKTVWIVGMLLALLLAGVVSYYASASPDGLEKVAADKGVDRHQRDHRMADSPTADYQVEGVHNARLSGGLAGVLGVAGTLVLGTGVFWVVRRSRRPAPESTPEQRGPA